MQQRYKVTLSTPARPDVYGAMTPVTFSTYPDVQAIEALGMYSFVTVCSLHAPWNIADAFFLARPC